MSAPYDIAVVGAGMMGSAAARHLAQDGRRVALIGPEEPDDPKQHRGVFASHYDAARITRALDTEADWASLATRAMARYPELDGAGGYVPCGALMAGPETGAFLQKAREVAAELATAHETLSPDALATRFPMLSFPSEIAGLYETRGGYIDPRAHVAAQINAARAAGAAYMPEEVTEASESAAGVTLKLTSGGMVRAERAIFACGAFSTAPGLLPAPLPLTVYARTVALLEVDAAEAERLSGMPSIVYVGPKDGPEPYILPPVRYPDGKIRLKIGGDPMDRQLADSAETRDWFRSGGDPAVRDLLAEQLFALMPGLRVQKVTMAACATTFTPNHRPIIAEVSPRRIALTAGNGAGAKCADELGYLAARLALGHTPEGYDTDFAVAVSPR